MAEPENRALTDKFMLRLPDGMRERIKVAAEGNRRSMNAEIVAALEVAYPAPPEIDEERALSEIFESMSIESRREFVYKYLDMFKITDEFVKEEFGFSRPRKDAPEA